MKSDSTFIGTVSRVAGAKVVVAMSSALPSTSPVVKGRLYRIGQIGSFIRIPVGYLDLFGVVSGVSSADLGDHNELQGRGPRSQRVLEVQLVGEGAAGSPFQRGLSQYPTLDDEVHIVTPSDLAAIYGSASLDAPVTIGSHAGSDGLAAVIDLDRLVSRHCAIVGSTGSGKSNTVAALLRAIAAGDYPSANIVIIDPHGEYGSAFDGISKVFRIGAATNPLVIPYWALSFDELGWFLVDRRSSSETAMDAQLRDSIYAFRQGSAPLMKASGGSPLMAEEITADAPVFFPIRELWYRFDREERRTWIDIARTNEALVAEGNAATLTSAQFRPHGQGNTAPFKNNPMPPMASFTAKVLAKLKDRRFDFMLDVGAYDGQQKDLDDLVGDWLDHEHSITVLDLAGVPFEVADLVVGLVTRVLFETMFWGRDAAGLGRQRPLLLVYEEAHAYLPRGEGAFIQGYARRSVQRVLREGRKYGVGAAVVTQRPSELDETILSQCGTFVALRLTNGQDQARVAAMVPDEIGGLTALLPALRTGEALVLGEAMPLPSRVRIDAADPRPDSGDPRVGQQWRQVRGDSEIATAITAWRRQRKTAVVPIPQAEN